MTANAKTNNLKLLFCLILSLKGYLLLSQISFHSIIPSETKPDAQSGATINYSFNPSVVLPPQSDFYFTGTLEGIEGFIVKYDCLLYRGGEISMPSGIYNLKRIKINTIFAINPSVDERDWADMAEIKYVELPFTLETFSRDDIKTFIEHYHNPSGVAFVQCSDGKNLSGILGVAYRLHILGWTYDEALQEFIALGGDAEKYKDLLLKVKTYQKR